MDSPDGSWISRNASREAPAVLVAGEGQLEERPGRLGQLGCAAGEKVDLTASAAHPGPNPGHPHAHPFPFKLLRDGAGAESAPAFGAGFLLEFTHRFFPRLVGDTHQLTARARGRGLGGIQPGAAGPGGNDSNR